MYSVLIHRVMAVSCIFGVIGCAGAAEDDAVTVSEQALYTPTGIQMWPGGRVKVCFSQDGDALAGWRNNVRLWLTSDIQASARVTYEGFARCDPNPGQEWLVVNNNGTQTGTIDNNGGNLGYSARNTIHFMDGSTPERHTVLHEFMHKLGFGHEFNRLNSTSTCEAQPTATRTGIPWTDEYDPNSIMNDSYCKMNFEKLSALDRKGLRKAYGDEAAPELPGSVGRRIAVSRNASGSLEVFYAGTGQALYHNYQLPNGWSGPQRLPGFAKQLVVAPNLDGRLDLIYIGTDDRLYHNFQTNLNGGWSGEVLLGGSAKQIALGRNASGALELFYVGTDNALYHNWQNGANGGWFGQVAFGGTAKQLSVARNEDGRLEVFYIGTNDLIYHRYQQVPGAGWSGETPLGGSAKQLLVARNQDGLLEIFYIGTNDGVYHRKQTPSGWGVEQFLFGSAKRLAVSRTVSGSLEVFYAGTNDALYHDYQVTPGGDWSHELALGGLAREVIVGQNGNGLLEVFYIGLNGFLYHNWQTPTGWGGEALLGGDVNEPPPPTLPPATSCGTGGTCLTAAECRHGEGQNDGQRSCPATTICCVL